MSRKPVLVAGIILEWTPIELAQQTLLMSRGELEKVLSSSPSWPFPASLDGWKLSHDAIRYDMEAIKTAIDTTKSRVYDGKALANWQVDAIRTVMLEFCSNVHKHQEHEEGILFPWMETRVKLPLKLPAAHRTLMGLMSGVRRLCDQLQPAEAEAAKASLALLSTAFSQLRLLMRQHLEEEEILGLPLLRKHFTAREAAVVEKRIVSDMKPASMAWFLRPMDMADKREAMRRLKVPGLVQRLVMLPAVRKDERTVLQAYRDLAAGEQTRPGAKGGAPWRRGGMTTCLVA